MPESEITKLRRARLRVHRHLARLEPLVASYQAKLAALDAEIQRLAPELWLNPRRYRPNPIFARGELTRFMLSVLREAGEPLPVRVIAVRVLAMKGVALPDAATRRRTRHRLRQLLIALDARGVTVRIGEGNKARRGLAAYL